MFGELKPSKKNILIEYVYVCIDVLLQYLLYKHKDLPAKEIGHNMIVFHSQSVLSDKTV